MNTIKNPKIAPTTEIAGALLLNRVDDATLNQFRADPKAVLVSNLNLNVGDDLAIRCVDNSADTVHLALPYYESIDVMKAGKLSDGNMEEVVGGEIIISIIIGAITGAALGAALGSIGGGAVIGGVVGGVVGAVVVSTAVGIGVGTGVNEENNAYEAGLAAGRAGETGGSGGGGGGGK